MVSAPKGRSTPWPGSSCHTTPTSYFSCRRACGSGCFDHLVWFVSNLVDSLGLSGILSAYEKSETWGRPGYNPVMMTNAHHGPGRRGDELSEGLATRTSRLERISEANAALEARAREKASAEVGEARKRVVRRERREAAHGGKLPGRRPSVPDPEKARPRDRDQRDFTDPDSRIMKDGATGSFVAAYNAHAAVDEDSQIIVCASVTQQANDKLALLPLLTQIEGHIGALPRHASADSGFYDECVLADPRLSGVECYVPPGRRTRTPLSDTMREKLASEANEAVYRKRKAIVEPVFGQIKEARGFRRFSFRGLRAVA